MAIPTSVIHNLESNSVLRTMAIDLSDKAEDRAAIIEILRSKLYSDKILAVLREYSTNAFDSHVEAGNGNEAIKVTLPTQIFPELRIRDFGIGLTPDEVESIYIKYGRSTKRATNEATGQLGLGCKSAFAYGDNFVVISYKDGVKTTYNLTINGVCATVAAEPMENDDRNGIEVIIPVNQSDIREFQDKAVNFFKYWKVCPILLGGDVDRIELLREELATKPIFADETWEIRPSTSYCGNENGVAVMGNIPYPINWSIISSKINLNSNDKDTILYDFVRRNKTIFRFNIGDLDFSASRESLEYTDKTCKTIINKTKVILDSIFNILNDKISSAPTYWDALLVYNQIFGRDDDKIFQGDVYKLENYYKGKFSWNGIVINNGYFNNIQHWSIENGYTEKEVSSNTTSILTVYEKRNDRIKQHKPVYYGNISIPASKKIRIVIHDLDKPVLTKTSARYIINEKFVNKVYMLKFRDKAQMNEFITKMHFESVPVIYISKIHDEIKQWLKQSRASSGGGTTTSGARDPQAVKFFVPDNKINKYGYRDDVFWAKDTIDIREEEGYYVDLVDGKARICGNEISNLSYVCHHIHVLLTALGEKVERIYALPERNRNAKWFKAALEDGQWTNIETYLESKRDQIIHGRGILIANAIKYFNNTNSSFQISINFAEKILPLLENKNGAMYKACIEILPDFKKMVELCNALRFFKMDIGLENDGNIDFEKFFKAVKKAYPMLDCVKDSNYIFSIGSSSKIDDDMLNKIAQYVNLVDKSLTN